MAEYIDKQAALETLKKTIAVNKNPNHDARVWEEGMNCAMTIIGAEPSADVQLVRHGQWVGYFEPGCESYHCTACGTAWYPEELYLGGNDYPKYCPECGAKMENWKSEIEGEQNG